MKTWLKGGLIGATIFIIILVISTIFFFYLESQLVPSMQGKSDSTYTSLALAPALLPGFLVLAILQLAPLIKNNVLLYILTAVITLAIYFLIGSLIGKRIQKIKSKREI